MASDKFWRLSVFGGSTNAHRTHPLISGAMVPLSADLTLATVSLGPWKFQNVGLNFGLSIDLNIALIFGDNEREKLSVPVKS